MRATLTTEEYETSSLRVPYKTGCGLNRRKPALSPKTCLFAYAPEAKGFILSTSCTQMFLRKGKKKNVSTKSKTAQGIFELHIKFHLVYPVEHDYFRVNP